MGLRVKEHGRKVTEVYQRPGLRSRLLSHSVHSFSVLTAVFQSKKMWLIEMSNFSVCSVRVERLDLKPLLPETSTFTLWLRPLS